MTSAGNKPSKPATTLRNHTEKVKQECVEEPISPKDGAASRQSFLTHPVQPTNSTTKHKKAFKDLHPMMQAYVTMKGHRDRFKYSLM